MDSAVTMLKWKSYGSTSKCYDGIFDLILDQNGLKMGQVLLPQQIIFNSVCTTELWMSS